VGNLDRAPSTAADGYSLQVAGRWAEAANIWLELGRVYEQADAMAEAPKDGPLLDALKILDHLGAVPRAAMVRRRLREMGVSSVPRGPNPATRASPAGLTARQTEVLGLLAENLTYRQIGERLHLSPKTVDHHVSAVLFKLGARTRADAVAAARRLNILSGKMGDSRLRHGDRFPTTTSGA
jgi:DNA-binding CsgD family transcriptional regulator